MARIKKTDLKKPWARTALARDVSIKRQVINIFLIYCEGVNTEPGYFKSFPVNSETIVEAVGLGMNRVGLVERILELCNDRGYLEGQRQFDPDRQIWCVFDRDSDGAIGTDDDLDAAIRLAESRGLRVAWSNDCFELWFYLHDHFLDNQLHRGQYYEHLSKRLGINYAKQGKEKEFSSSLYDIFRDKQVSAIRHAQKLDHFHKEEQRPSRRNPGTTVHELVLELNECLTR